MYGGVSLLHAVDITIVFAIHSSIDFSINGLRTGGWIKNLNITSQRVPNTVQNFIKLIDLIMRFELTRKNFRHDSPFLRNDLTAIHLIKRSVDLQLWIIVNFGW